MTVLYWIFGVLAAVLGAGSALSFVIFIASGDDLWVKRARKLRRLMSAALLFLFNLWIWSRVILVIVNWS